MTFSPLSPPPLPTSAVTNTPPRKLPTHFQVPFIGLLLLLSVAVYELINPGDRLLWLVVSAATIAGAYLKPAVAAVLGWLLVLVLAAYLTVNSAFSPVSGASWLTLLIMPWLPPFASNAAAYVRQNQQRLARQDALLSSGQSLHPSTNLPTALIAAQLLPSLNAHIIRQHHQGVLVDVKVANLDTLRSLTTPEEFDHLISGVRDALRQSLRGSDWLFQTADDHMLILADLGERATGAVPDEVQQLFGDIKHSIANLLRGSEQLRRAADQSGPGGVATSGRQVLLQKLHSTLQRLPQLELEIRTLLLPDVLPDFPALMTELAGQPALSNVPGSVQPVPEHA